MNEKTKKFIIPIITLIVMIGIIYYVCRDGNYKMFMHFNGIGLQLYYELQNPGFYLPFYIFILYLSANIYAIDFFRYKQTKFNNMIICRKGHKDLFFSNIKKIIISSFMFRLLCHVITLIIINYFFIPIKFNLSVLEATDSIFHIFSHSTILSLIIYVFYSCIGFTIFSLFMYSMIYMIKNIYVYRVFGVIAGIFGYVITSIVYSILYSNGISEAFVQIFCYTFFTGSLLSPGLDVLGPSGLIVNVHIVTLVTFVSYLLVTTGLLAIQYKMEKKYG